MQILKRVGTALTVAALGAALLIAAEVALVMRKEFLPTEPALEIEGEVGPEDGRPLRFVVLGDSTAAGLGAGTAELSYPVQLAKMLAADGYRVSYRSVGVSGARIADVLDEQIDAALAFEPDLVFVAIGANDVVHLTSLSDVRRDASAIYSKLLAADVTLVAGGVPDMRADAFPEPLRSIAGWRGREVTGELRRAAAEVDVPVVPIAEGAGPFFLENPDDAYAADLFHPGPGGYRRWAEVIYPYLREALGSSEG